MLSNHTHATLERAARIEGMSHRALMPRTTNKHNKHNNKHNKHQTRKNGDENQEGVDFVVRMDRKLRATRIKLEQQRQATFKKDRDKARNTDKTWAEVEKSFFKRLNGGARRSPRRQEERAEERLQRRHRTTGGKGGYQPATTAWLVGWLVGV